MTVVSMNYLLEAGVHFGHQKRRWNPKMKEYIYTSRDDIYIIDLQKTVQKLEEAYEAMKEIAQNEGTFLFVGTKKQASEAVEEAAARTNSFFVNERWLGGTLTNFRTIRSRVKRMDEIEEMETNGTFDLLPNKEVILLKKEYDKLHKNLRGIRTMAKLPDCLVIVDPKKEEIAIKEAHKLGIPVVGLVDTNCDPDVVDYVIPGNDDAVRSVKLLIGVLANAIAEVNNLEVVDYITEDDKTKKEILGEGEVLNKEDTKVEVVEEPKKKAPKAKKEEKEEVKEEKEEKKEAKPKKEAKAKKEEPKEDLASLTVADLKAKAKEAGISGYSTMKKADLVKALSK